MKNCKINAGPIGQKINHKTASFASWLNLLAATAVGVACQAGAATIRVPQDQPTITAGIAAAQEGDTVLVSNGTYQEHNITITNAITVTSLNGSAVTGVDGQQISGTRIFTVKSKSSNWATISGFSIVNAAV